METDIRDDLTCLTTVPFELFLTTDLHAVFIIIANYHHPFQRGARYSSVVRAFAHGAMGRRIDPSWGGPIELFLIPASDPRLV